MLWAMSESSLLGGGIFLFIVFTVQGAQDQIPSSTVSHQIKKLSQNLL